MAHRITGIALKREGRCSAAVLPDPRAALALHRGTVSFEDIIASANDAAPIDAHVYNHLPPFPIWEWDSKPHLENPAGFLGLPTGSATMCAVSGLPHS